MSSSGKKTSFVVLVILLLFFSIFIIIFYKVHLIHEEQDSKPHPHLPIIPMNNKPTPIPSSDTIIPSLTLVPPLDNPKQSSPNAYITLLSGMNPSFTHRGFLYNILIMKKMLHEVGSTADFIVMIGYLNDPTKGNIDLSIYNEDLNLLKSHGIIIYELPRYLSSSKYKLNFAEMALLKITPFSLLHYEKIQYFDGDIMPMHNMDCYFQLQQNTYTIGAVSPLNSGWFLILPNLKIYNFLQSKAIWRLTRDWDKEKGWGHAFPDNVFYTRGRKKMITLWDFNGADMDQGLFLYFFAFFYGNLYLIDTDLKEIYYYMKGLYADSLLSELLSKQEALVKDEIEHQKNLLEQEKREREGIIVDPEFLEAEEKRQAAKQQQQAAKVKNEFRFTNVR